MKERERWIPVSERLPEMDTLVLFYDLANGVIIAELDPKHRLGMRITHWRHLPTPPVQEAENGR